MRTLWERGYTTTFSCSGIFEEHRERQTEVVGGETITHQYYPQLIFGPCTPGQELRIERAARLTLGAYVKDPSFGGGNPAVLWYFGTRCRLRRIPEGPVRDRLIRLQFLAFSLLV